MTTLITDYSQHRACLTKESKIDDGNRNDAPSRTCEIEAREEWILRLLYATDENDESRPVYGETRLMMATFLLQRKLRENFEKTAGFEFTAGKFGPHDEGVLDALDCLAEYGYVERTPEALHDSEYEGDEFRLTPKGEQEAKRFFDRLSEESRSWSTG
ncbi:hypothetical protein [Halorussus caseinilyticus]|uniref:Uncharacterized protein n=1 Tax=Halorussus caseinilyticus TaxID=3034025 RepID=A0ABD5WEC5_9EURY